MKTIDIRSYVNQYANENQAAVALKVHNHQLARWVGYAVKGDKVMVHLSDTGKPERVRVGRWREQEYRVG